MNYVKGGIEKNSIHKKNIDEIYNYAEGVIKNFIDSESSFDDFYILRDIIYDCIASNDIVFNDLLRNGIIHVHLVNVSVLSGLIAKNMNFDEDFIKTSILGGLLHDIGKFYISERIINKPGKLSTFECIAVSSHECIGQKIISLFCKSKEITNIICFHHTYVKSLQLPVSLLNMDKDDELLLPLICSIADITDAVTSIRPYKKELPIRIARNDLHIKGISDIDTIYNRIGINID